MTVISLLLELLLFFFHLMEFRGTWSGVRARGSFAGGPKGGLPSTTDQRRPRLSFKFGSSAIKLFSYSLSIR